MADVVRTVAAIRVALSSRRDLLFEILALRHQVTVLARSNRRFRRSDRLLWAKVARGAGAGAAGHRRPLASRLVPLELVAPCATSWKTAHRPGVPRLDSALGGGESSVGCSAASRRAPHARHRRLRTHGIAVPEGPAKESVTDLADLPRESLRPVDVHVADAVVARVGRRHRRRLCHNLLFTSVVRRRRSVEAICGAQARRRR
jgi:hypothetical protein